MEPIDFKYTPRHFVYRAESESFRSLPLTTRTYGEYFRKLVNKDGGWLALRGRAPAHALRVASGGEITRTDHRMVKRTVADLLAAGFLELGTLDENGDFLPLGSGDHLAIRDWVPSQLGMSERETRAWYAEREAKVAHYLATQHAATSQCTAEEPTRDAVVPLAGAATEHRQCTDDAPTVTRQCRDRSTTSRNSNGTDRALFHTIPFRNPPISPQGESAGADERESFSSSLRESPPEDLAAKAVEWLNRQQSRHVTFRADSKQVRRQARRWLREGWDWRLVQQALKLRLAALKAVKPDDWRNWATPATLFNGKLEGYVDQARAGHRYDHHGSGERVQRQSQQADQQRRDEAERAFADVLEVVALVGPDGPWESELPNSLSRTAIRAMGWPRIAQQPDAARDEFICRYVGDWQP